MSGRRSRSEARLARWLKLTGALYALGAVGFVARPNDATDTLSALGSAWGEALDPEPPGIYNSLAGAYMATIAALALSASADPDERRGLIPPLLVAKATSSAAFLQRYLATRRPGFAIAAGIDAFLLGVTGGLYANIRQAAPRRAR